MTSEEVEAEWHKWVDGRDPKARKRLIEFYVPWVRSMAGKYARSLPDHLELDDLTSCGVIGMIDAVNRYDPSTGVSFYGFSKLRIIGAIQDSLRRDDWAPRTVRRNNRKVEQAVATLSHKKAGTPTEDEVAHYLGLSAKELARCRSQEDAAKVGNLQVALDAGIEPVSTEADPVNVLVNEETKTLVRESVHKVLTEREQLVLRLYYEGRMPMIDIGEMLGLTEGRISQIHATIIHKLQQEVA